MVDRQELVRDQVIAGAKSVPQLVEAAKVADPDLFAALKGMPAARLYAPPATAIIAWLAGRYGLDWPPDVCSAIALFLVSVGAGVVHALKPTPVAKLAMVGALLLGSASSCATATTSAAVGTAIVAGQLFCAAQPAVVRVIGLDGGPVSVLGRTALEVAAICGILGGVPVAPPANAAAAPVMQAPVDSTVPED
jgi:hypothetical protein